MIGSVSQGQLEQFVAWLTGCFLPLVQQRLTELILAPETNPEMIWMIIPLAITTLVMTLYFGKNWEEELGWNTATGNALVLVFVSIDLMRHLHYTSAYEGLLAYYYEPYKTIAALFVLFEGALLLVLNFFHILPKRLTFFISSPLPINLIAYVAMTVVYTNMAFDYATFVAATLLFAMLYVLLMLVKYAVKLSSDYVRKEKELELREEELVKKAKLQARIEQEVKKEEKIEEKKEEEEKNEIKERVKEELKEQEEEKEKEDEEIAEKVKERIEKEVKKKPKPKKKKEQGDTDVI